MQGTITDESSRQAGVQSQINAINEALAERVGKQKYGIWFKNSTKLSIAGGYLKIGVPNLFIASWIENHFLNDILQASQTATGTKLKITFSIDPELSGGLRRMRLDSHVAPPSDGRGGSVLNSKETLSTLVSTEPVPRNIQPSQPLRRSRFVESGRTVAGQENASKQQTLTLDNFVVGPSNELAYNAAKAVVNEKHSPFNPLFIHGGYGLGKTHLLQGICNEMGRHRPEAKWLYMSAEDFTNQFVLALKLKKLEDFRRRIRQTDLLAIDDIHFLASKPSTQEEFLHTFNTINLAGKQVVLVSDAHPKMIGSLSEKLVSRFVSGMVVKIEPPDFQTRCQICRRFVEARIGSRGAVPKKIENPPHAEIPDSVIRYIAENVRTNVRELEGALLKLIAYSALQNEKVTLSMAQTILADHLERCDPIVRISDIESAVAAYFGETIANIRSSKKDRTVSLARHFSMYLTRKHTSMSSCEIGKFMGNKNHATVLLACKRIEEMIKQNAEVHWQGPNGNKIAKARTILAHLEERISG